MKTQTQPQISIFKHKKRNALEMFIVEDNPAYSYMLTYNLKQEFNFNITNFDSGEDCLKNIAKHHPAIIILDYKLKNMNGVNVLHYVKRNYPEIYVILLTGQKDIRTAVEIMKEGAFDYIQKSATALDELKNVIYKYFEDMDINEQKRMN